MSTRRGSYSKRQSGVALVVVLILLLVMTLLGLASLRGTLMEERMSANLFDRSLMFQAAEAALREGETRAGNSKKSQYTDACTNGLCASPNPANDAQYVDRWLQTDSSKYYYSATKVVSGGLDVTPEYFIEYMGEAPNWVGCDREVPQQAGCMGPRYRVTARAGVGGRAQILLQSAYTSPE